MSFYRACFIPAQAEAFFVLRSLDVAPLSERASMKDIIGYPDWKDPVTAIAEKIRQRGYDRARLGIDLTSHALTVQTFEALKRELPHVEFVDGLPWKMRKLKSKPGSAINDAVMQEIVTAAEPGLTEREALRMVVEATLRYGGDGASPVVTSARAGIACTDTFTITLSRKGMCSTWNSFPAWVKTSQTTGNQDTCLADLEAMSSLRYRRGNRLNVSTQPAFSWKSTVIGHRSRVVSHTPRSWPISTASEVEVVFCVLKPVKMPAATDRAGR
ncbi:aminopeptidase P family N-terminal domain-containing protein [Bradyrhizobium sp. 172]|uniref:aminopeptidase P family N-terminal domain-containing protein n=1 Tax=Bradyrhizobium sp. 172 TaxID=2782643 RepID=UPI001FFFBAC5|nr:aminopeptidase P family N-terminal domain-containing protein [Bradyrhizobium sp. 172]UPJ94927.1 aminopeptidase P family N-terminal domain-containing protein [Bradyrhizobium sp. 172]